MGIKDRCKCGVEIVWLAHERTNKPAPIEVAPRPDGNILPLKIVGDEQRLTTSEDADGYRVLGKADKAGFVESFGDVPRYASHIVTCKDAPHWRDREQAQP